MILSPGVINMPEPIYNQNSTVPAYQLNWSLTLFWKENPAPQADWFEPLQENVERDGVRILECKSKDKTSQFLLSTRPNIPPEKLVWSVKGRLQSIIRHERPGAFKRKYAYRSIGTTSRERIDNYIEHQLGHHRMADPRVQRRLAKYQHEYPDVDLSEPSCSAHGRYWYNLHLALVTDHRYIELRDEVLTLWGSTIEKTARKHGHDLARTGVLPEHLHILLGCTQDQTPDGVALSYMNNLAYVVGNKPIFMPSFYVGTVGEYNLRSVRL